MGNDPSVLPTGLERAVRTASVAPHVRSLFNHLPQPIRIDAMLPADPGRIPSSALCLLKLALGDRRVRLGEVGEADAVRLVVSVDRPGASRACVLDAYRMRADLREVAHHLLGALFDGADVARLLEAFAFHSSSLATLRRITNHMLRATEPDQALHVMLSGITSGYGLAFHRAAVFVLEGDQFVGAHAVGPADEAEAHRIWEAIELRDLTLEETLAAARYDTQLQERVQGLRLPMDDQVVAATLEGAAPRVWPANALAALDPVHGFALAPIRAHDRVVGLVFADNRFGGAEVSAEQVAHLGLYVDQTALVWENLTLLRRVEALARTDALTGVLNRREFEARLASEASRCDRSGGSCAVVLLDVDHFKQVNDADGHAAGDATLRTLGALLRAEVRGHDLAARLGGDEFALLLPDAGAPEASAAAARIGALALAQAISLSVGAASWTEAEGDAASLLKLADDRLYEAKRAGRGQGWGTEGAIRFAGAGTAPAGITT